MANNMQPISFWTLISEYSIEIPIIQRDYAQGRADDEIKKKRGKFLEALHSAITTIDKQQTLDFVYGDEKNGRFQPLDGQQRLTTLFLLHWFIATKESTEENRLREIVVPILNKFTYETRTSSREFCEKLVKESCKLTNAEPVSTTIKTRTNWWVLSWEKDPTIKAMLNMLDAIQEKFIENNLWDILISDKVTFINIPIKDFGLSDDLYVKMNARGKSLTDFENWKAEFEKHISIKDWENETVITETFAHKMDTEWTDLFWKYKDESNKIDAKIWNFIRNIQLINVALTRNNLGVKINLEIFPYYDPISYNDSDYKQLCDSLSIWAEADNNNHNLYELKWVGDKSENAIFNFIINGEADYADLVLFYGETIALREKMALNSEEALDWMRVIRNIVENSTIDSLSTFRGALLLVNEISKGCNSIYKWLSSNSIKSNFASTQIKEEQVKAKLICSNREWKEEIFRCEDSDLCYGRIDFALKCIDYDKDAKGFDYEAFINVTNIITNYLSKVSELSIKHKLWRVFLTISDHKFYNCWESWSYVVDCRKRWIPNDIDNLRDYCNNEYASNNNGSQYYAIGLVKGLLSTDLDSYLSGYLCPDNMPKWKQKLITQKNLIQYCTEGYLCVSDNEDECWLINGQRPSDIDRYTQII